jgi:hypothetical protein
MSRETWEKAWRERRAGNLGTLNFTFSRDLALFAMDAFSTRNAEMYRASEFKAFGYYSRGMKRF